MGQKLGTQGEGCWCCAPTDADNGELHTPTVQQAYGSPTRDASVPSLGGSAARTASASPAASSGGGVVGFDLILSDLDSAEQLAYGEAFAKLDTHHIGCVALDNAGLREFIKANSWICESDLDVELLKVGSLDDGGLSLPNFLQLLRENALSDTVGIEAFLGASSDGVTITAQDCRSHLLMLAQRRLHAQFGEDQWDRIFNTVMMDADVVVPMEQWITYSNQVARIVRLARYAQA